MWGRGRRCRATFSNLPESYHEGMRFGLFLIATALAMAGEFTTSIGGAYPHLVSAITTDSAGNTYVVGSRQLPGTPAFVNSFVEQANSDVFLTKLDPKGSVLFTDTFAGKGVDLGAAIAVDPSGNIYIAGATTSPDFPLSRALQTQIFPSGPGSGFIVKLTNDGATILYSTYFGGTLGQSSITSLATDSKGNLYLTGYTQAADFPHTTGMPFGKITQRPASPGAIIASISAAGDKILYSGAIPMATPCTLDDSSCINNGIMWEGVGIAVDAAGNAYIAGNDGSATNLPTTAGVLSPNGIGAFVAKVNAGGTGLSYLTYIGSGQIGNSPYLAPENILYAIAVDAAGNAYLAGQTFDPNFAATAGSLQPTNISVNGTSGFLGKLKPDGSAMVWATYFQAPQSIAIDAGGNVWATGTTSYSTFPNSNGWSTGPEFLAEVNATGSQLTYSALYPTGTVAQSVALDPSGLVHVAGVNGFVSAIAPTTAPAMKIFDFQNAAGGNVTARISPAEVIAIYGPGIGPAAAATGTPANGFYPTTLAGVQVAINGANIPLLYVSANQINAVAPMELASDTAATVRVTNGTTVSPDYPVWIVASAPQAFAPLLNQDGTINSQTNPAKSGSIVTFYATGWQSTFSPLADGQVATVAQDACLGACRAAAGTVPIPFSSQYVLPATVLYGGAAPGMVAGVTQFNVQLGAFSATGGIYAFNLTVAGPSSTGPTVSQTLWVTP
jgi:uncharacterized protein (TIGR03437 family)